MQKVKVGQVYQDNDPRCQGTRTLQVTKVTLETMPKSRKGNYGNSAEFADCDVFIDGVKSKKPTRIHTARMMKDTTGGYKLLNIHALPKYRRVAMHAEHLAMLIDSLVEAPASDLSYHIKQLHATSKEGMKLVEGIS